MKRLIATIDCETDPFKHGRVPEPFIWGIYDGKEFRHFNTTEKFVGYIRDKHCLLYAHNGGKFDFMFLLNYVNISRVKIIKSRLVEMQIGKATLRDSWSIIPIALADYQKQTFDYWKLERHCRRTHMPEIVDYLRSDCRNLYQLVMEYRKQAGNRLTIASNALAFSKKLDINIGKSSKKFDDIFRKFYFGGRCEAFVKGVQNNVDLYDIKSAYPFAMTFQHPTGIDFTYSDDISKFDNERLQKCFIDIECHSCGAFPIRERNGLYFPHDFNRYFVTGWEFTTAIRYNLIHDIVIHGVYEFYNTIDFIPYVAHWFTHKEEAHRKKDKANTIIGKIMLNSLYGKLCQNPTTYKDYKIMPGGSEIEEGWNLESEFGDKEIHSRPVLYDLQMRHGLEWIHKPIYYNVATGASITGYVRAMLLDTIHRVGAGNALYVDTDCLFVKSNGASANIETGSQLGQWDWKGRADAFYCAGRKLYGAELVEGPEKGIKLASKGARLTFAEIKRITNGENVIWKSNAPSFSFDRNPQFVVRSIRATA